MQVVDELQEVREPIDLAVARIMGEAEQLPDGTYILRVGNATTAAKLTGVTLASDDAGIGKAFTLPRPAVIEKTDEPRRKPVRFLPEYVQAEHDGPDPMTLPRRARRMRIPGRHEFHLHDRRRRPAI